MMKNIQHHVTTRATTSQHVTFERSEASTKTRGETANHADSSLLLALPLHVPDTGGGRSCWVRSVSVDSVYL